MSVHFQGKPFNITVIQVYDPTTSAKEAEVHQFYDDLEDLLELTSKRDVLFIIENWTAQIGSQEIPGVKGKFGLGEQIEAGQWLTQFCQENALVISNTLSSNTRDDFIHGYHQTVNTKIKLITFFVAKDGEAVYSKQKTTKNKKQDLELTVAQIISFSKQNSGLN